MWLCTAQVVAEGQVDELHARPALLVTVVAPNDIRQKTRKYGNSISEGL